MRAAAVFACLLAGCHPQIAPAVPGQTDIGVTEVTIEPRAGEHLTIPYHALIETLGLRHGSAIFPARRFNEFRLAEDRRRIGSYLTAHGYFDAVVDDPHLDFTPDQKHVAVTWHVHEGPAYHVGSVTLVGAPPEHASELREMIPFGPGAAIDLDAYRPLRRALAEHLQDLGYGHARGYSRVFVNREAKTVAWYYYLDPGPLTRIGDVSVEGARQVSTSSILERAHLVPGAPYSTAEKRRAELALLDTGAFASAVVVSDADIQTGPPEYPDTGGALAPEQVDPNGDLVPRKLPDGVALRIIVVEAPAKQVRGEVGVEGDPTRIDTYAGTRVVLRNALGVQYHIVVEGHVGYGWIIDENPHPAEGLYGSAKLDYVHPGWIRRDLDLRLGARWRDVLYPAALLREIRIGPGIHHTVRPGVFYDVDLDYRVGITKNLPPIDAMQRAAVDLPDDNRSQEAELSAQFVVDRRDDRVEPAAGWLVSGRTALGFGDDRWGLLGGDVRAFKKIGGPWSVGARVSGAAVVFTGASGLPFGPRLFGGGAWGMRGFGRDHLSPTVCADTGMATCDAIEVGGKSLLESSLELRMLPYRKFYGAAAFVDVGGAGTGLDPTGDGLSAAFGIGLRVRSWYVPISLDISYRALDRGDWRAPSGLQRALMLFRIGEAF